MPTFTIHKPPALEQHLADAARDAMTQTVRLLGERYGFDAELELKEMNIQGYKLAERGTKLAPPPLEIAPAMQILVNNLLKHSDRTRKPSRFASDSVIKEHTKKVDLATREIVDLVSKFKSIFSLVRSDRGTSTRYHSGCLLNCGHTCLCDNFCFTTVFHQSFQHLDMSGVDDTSAGGDSDISVPKYSSYWKNIGKMWIDARKEMDLTKRSCMLKIATNQVNSAPSLVSVIPDDILEIITANVANSQFQKRSSTVSRLESTRVDDLYKLMAERRVMYQTHRSAVGRVQKWQVYSAKASLYRAKNVNKKSTPKIIAEREAELKTIESAYNATMKRNAEECADWTRRHSEVIKRK
jgi:hypothetical protein